MQDLPFRPELENIKEYIAGKGIEDAIAYTGGLPPVKLASNENPLGPSPKALEAFRKLHNEISVYPDQNATHLCEAIAKRHAMKPENVIIGNGSDEIMLLIGLAFLSAGEESVISRNTFSIYEFVTTLLGGKPVFADQKDGKYDLVHIQKNITNSTRLVWIANPNNPTGTYVNDSGLRALLGKMPKGIYIVLDEAYAEYAEASDFPNSGGLLKDFPSLIVLRTFSKAYGLAGLRMGYGLAQEAIIQTLNKTRMPFNANRAAQTAARAALEDAEHIARSRKNNAEGKRYLCDQLERLKVAYWKTEANFICMHLPPNLNADKAFMEIMKRGVVVRPLTSFGLPQSVRVTVGTQVQNEKFIQALGEILA